MKPKVLVLTGYGINCDEETAFAFQLNGAESEIVHINDLISGAKKLADFQILAFPGGFSYGDDTGSGKALANKIQANLWDDLMKFIDSDKLIIGICNGFQVLVNLGLFPTAEENDFGKREIALKYNNSNRFQCRWVDLSADSKKCVFTKEIENLSLPVAHGEGLFFAQNDTLNALNKNDQVVLRYTKEGKRANGEFPFNPNGAIEDIAAVCDSTGRIFGTMPHPERAIFAINHLDFQNKKEELVRNSKKALEHYDPAMQIFKNATKYFK